MASSHIHSIGVGAAAHEGLALFSGADDAYVLVTSPDGHVLWQTHGPLSDSAYADLQANVTKLTADPKP